MIYALCVIVPILNFMYCKAYLLLDEKTVLSLLGMYNMSLTTDPFVKICCDYGGSCTLFVVKQFPSRKYVVAQTIYCVVSCVFIIPIVLLNSISALTISKRSHLEAKNCYFLILIQSVIDLAVGIISLPLEIILAAVELRGAASCVSVVVLEAIAYLPAGISMTIIFLLTLERYLGILHPIIHRSHVTKMRILMCVCCCIGWVVITGPVFRIISEHLHTIANVTTLFVVLALNTFAYTRIYYAVKSMQFSNDRIGDCSTEENSSKMVDKRKSLRERNIAQSCAMVVFISYLSFIPFTVCYFYFENDHLNFRIATCWAWNLVTLNSGLNSLVFFWKRPLLRQEAMYVLRKMSRE